MRHLEQQYHGQRRVSFLETQSISLQSKNASIWNQNCRSKKNGYFLIATSLLKQNYTSNVLEPCLLVWPGDCMVEFLCINARVCAPLPLTKIREACVKKLLANLHVLWYIIGHMQKTWNIFLRIGSLRQHFKKKNFKTPIWTISLAT
jgi:hypothetical protein